MYMLFHPVAKETSYWEWHRHSDISRARLCPILSKGYSLTIPTHLHYCTGWKSKYTLHQISVRNVTIMIYWCCVYIHVFICVYIQFTFKTLYSIYSCWSWYENVYIKMNYALNNFRAVHSKLTGSILNLLRRTCQFSLFRVISNTMLAGLLEHVVHILSTIQMLLSLLHL